MATGMVLPTAANWMMRAFSRAERTASRLSVSSMPMVAVISAVLLARMFWRDWARFLRSISLDTWRLSRSSSATSFARSIFRLWNPLKPHRRQKRETVASLVPLAFASCATVISTTDFLFSMI